MPQTLSVWIVESKQPSSHAQFDTDQILVGRDPAQCQVVLHPEDPDCGRVHAILRRSATGWRVHVEHDHGVELTDNLRPRWVPKGESREIHGDTRLRLGRNGPVIRVLPVGGPVGGTAIGGAEAGQHLISSEVTRREVLLARLAPRRIAVVGVLALLASLITGFVVWQVMAARVREANQQAQLAREAAAVAGKEAHAASTKIDALVGVDDALRSKLKALSRGVLFVGMLDADKHFTPMGTAWAIDRTRLATNAHVAAIFKERGLFTMVARRASLDGQGEPEDFIITKVTIHAGYEHWQPRMALPQLRIGAGGTFEEVKLISPCDLALMEISGEITPVLPIAPMEKILALQSSDPLVLIGYPVENVPDAQRHVPPTFASGRVTKVASYFNEAAPPAESWLIQHDVVATGGASGSPMVNRDGEVVCVLSAGAIVPVLGGRAPVGLNYAQRADLLSELLNDTHEAKQSLRDQAWMKWCDDAKINPVSRFESDLSGYTPEGTSEGLDRINQWSAPLVNDQWSTTQTLEPGTYMLFAATMDASPLELEITPSDAVGTIERWMPMSIRTWSRDLEYAAQFKVDKKQELTLTINAEQPRVKDGRVYVFLMKDKPGQALPPDPAP